MPLHPVLHERHAPALVGVGDDAGRPARHERQWPESRSARTSWPSTSTTRPPERPPAIGQRLQAHVRSVASPCWRPFRSTMTVRLSSRNCAAAIAASQLLPSCSSPSPVSTNVRQARRSILAASAAPTAIGRPCPSGPVFASTPGTLLRSGCPFSSDSGCMYVDSTRLGKKPASASVAYSAADAVALAEDEAIPSADPRDSRGRPRESEVERREDVGG